VPIVQAVVNEGIAPREPCEKVFVVDVIDRNVEVLITTDERCIVVEPPIKHRHNMRDIAVLESLGPA